MSYKDRFAITDIRKGRKDNLSINMDENPESETDDIGAILLFTPDMENTIEHWHVPLDVKQATVLRDWLNEFLAEEDLKARFIADMEKNK